MLSVCITHIILWLPQTVMLLAGFDAHAHNCVKSEITTSVAALCGISSSALNFVLYSLTVKRFRDAAWIKVRSIFCCFKPQQQSHLLHQNAIKVNRSARLSNQSKETSV